MTMPSTSITNADNDRAAVNTEDRELWVAIGVSTLVLLMTLLAASVLYVYFGGAFLERRYNAIGEVIMREAEKLEDARMFNEAAQRYELALQARFAGEANRVHSMKRLGKIWVDQGNFEGALPWLEQAVSGADADRTAYAPLVQALLALNRMEEAERRLQQWRQAIEKDALRYESAGVLYFSGQLAEKQGNSDQAKVLYEQGADTFRDARCMVRLAEIQAEIGNRQDALQLLEKYLLDGAKDDLGPRARQLYLKLSEPAS